MGCNNKVKHTCLDKQYATCVHYEGEVNETSPLQDEQCLTVEETTQDLYNQNTGVRDEIDLDSLGNRCLEYVEDKNGRIVVKNVLLKYEQEICDLKEKIETLETQSICNVDITQCGIDLEGLVDSCNNPITTLAQLLIHITNQQQ